MGLGANESSMATGGPRPIGLGVLIKATTLPHRKAFLWRAVFANR